MVIKIILSVVLFIHGMAHIGGILAPFKADKAGFKNAPWLFSDKVLLSSGIGMFWGVLWFIACAGFIASAFGFYFDKSWVAVVVAISAVYSLIAMVPWWKAVPPGAKVGMVFDVIVIVFLLVSGRIL
ncbi:MAG: hypothetical protein ABFS16_10895 [Bacteroidota bacterium]